MEVLSYVRGDPAIFVEAIAAVGLIFAAAYLFFD
jgi:hypothetical protein